MRRSRSVIPPSPDPLRGRGRARAREAPPRSMAMLERQLQADLQTLKSEAGKRYPAVRDAAGRRPTAPCEGRATRGWAGVQRCGQHTRRRAAGVCDAPLSSSSPPLRTDWTRLVPPPVLTGHVSSLLPN